MDIKAIKEEFLTELKSLRLMAPEDMKDVYEEDAESIYAEAEEMLVEHLPTIVDFCNITERAAVRLVAAYSEIQEVFLALGDGMYADAPAYANYLDVLVDKALSIIDLANKRRAKKHGDYDILNIAEMLQMETIVTHESVDKALTTQRLVSALLFGDEYADAIREVYSRYSCEDDDECDVSDVIEGDYDEDVEELFYSRFGPDFEDAFDDDECDCAYCDGCDGCAEDYDGFNDDLESDDFGNDDLIDELDDGALFEGIRPDYLDISDVSPIVRDVLDQYENSAVMRFFADCPAEDKLLRGKLVMHYEPAAGSEEDMTMILHEIHEAIAGVLERHGFPKEEGEAYYV